MLTTAAALLTLSLWPAAELQGHRTFRVREAATGHLRQLGTVAYPALARGLQGRCPEIRARCYRLLEPVREAWAWEVAATLLPDDYPRLPWYDQDDTGTLNAWVEEARVRLKGYCGPGYGWPEYRAATRLRVASYLREGKAVPWVREWLNHLRDREVAWITAHGAQLNPPVTLPKGYKP